MTLRDFWLDDVLPFSCCPMFMLPRNVYDELPKMWVMCDSPVNGTRTRDAGAMEPIYWNPASPVFKMSEAEAVSDPQHPRNWPGASRGRHPAQHATRRPVRRALQSPCPVGS